LASSELLAKLQQLDDQLQILSDPNVLLREPYDQRDVWTRKVKELQQDAASIRAQAEQYDRIVSVNQRHERDRNELLRRRRNAKGGDNQNDMTNLVQEGESWQQSNQMVNQLLYTGEEQLNHLVKQKQQLRGVNKFIGMIDNSLGISQSTMRIIERRDITDAYFVFGGMIITMIVFYVVWFVY
jgi:golgi SNAP receptor complex member 2